MHRNNDFFSTPVEFIKGVGPFRAEILKKELEIFTCEDLLNHFPFRYEDRTRIHKISEVVSDSAYIQIKGTLKTISIVGIGRSVRLIAKIQDDSGVMELVWFRSVKWIHKNLKSEIEYLVFGKPTIFNGKINIVHPDMELVSEINEGKTSGLHPVYNTTEKMKAKGIDSKAFQKIVRLALEMMPEEINEVINSDIIKRHSFVSRSQALKGIHIPSVEYDSEQAAKRLKFEELFFLQLKILTQKLKREEKLLGYPFPHKGDFIKRFYRENLPFPLTGAQVRVMNEIRQDLLSGKQMNRMLQGDVGSGKTLVALMSMLLALGNNSQACLMAPTEILAMQHFATLSELVQGLEVRIELLTGNVKGKERKKILADLESGEIHILIGTHAVIEDKVKFHSLGLVVIDEQHRFGVEQRAKLWKKGVIPPHVLVMTATPIPRTLAMTIYGDLDTSVIDELPPGRKPVTTIHLYDKNRFEVFESIRKQIAEGRQVYIVYPLIDESETLDYKALMEGFEIISDAFPMPKYQVSIVHGKLKPADREYEMKRFVNGQTHIMVATTVIEVGVNVPNASVMIIESAERFGLSQLHQLRGRVGRGADQSFCVLMTSFKLTAEARLRIDTMVRTNDGFEIAEIDLKLRGPGDMMGTQQSGILDLKIADLARDVRLLQMARDEAIELLKQDPELIAVSNLMIREHYLALNKNTQNFSRIS